MHVRRLIQPVNPSRIDVHLSCRIHNFVAPYLVYKRDLKTGLDLCNLAQPLRAIKCRLPRALVVPWIGQVVRCCRDRDWRFRVALLGLDGYSLAQFKRASKNVSRGNTERSFGTVLVRRKVHLAFDNHSGCILFPQQFHNLRKTLLSHLPP